MMLNRFKTEKKKKKMIHWTLELLRKVKKLFKRRKKLKLHQKLKDIVKILEDSNQLPTYRPKELGPYLVNDIFFKIKGNDFE